MLQVFREELELWLSTQNKPIKIISSEAALTHNYDLRRWFSTITSLRVRTLLPTKFKITVFLVLQINQTLPLSILSISHDLNLSLVHVVQTDVLYRMQPTFILVSTSFSLISSRT